MTTSTRQEILRVLDELSQLCPDVRFGQLVVNLAYLANGPTNEAIWDVEDEAFLAAAKKHLENRARRQLPDSNSVPIPSQQPM